MAADPNDPNAQDIEDLIDGNICRCTGYRPILDAFKSFANDKSPDLQNKLDKMTSSAQRKCPITQKNCVGNNICKTSGKRQNSKILETAAKFGDFSWALKKEPIPSQLTADANWLFPHSLPEVMEILKNLNDDNKYRLIAGNTGTGI